MTQGPDIDGVLIEWGDRLFYPPNRRVRSSEQLSGSPRRRRADAIRARILGTVVRKGPQVMVKVTGGGRGMKAISAHFRYISKNGRLSMEDERGQMVTGKSAVGEMTEDWRYGGALIESDSCRREALNIILSMPAGTNADAVQKAAREFAKQEFMNHKFVMVLHEHQANPHVHLCVRAESLAGRRLNPRKAELQQWREKFAEKLRDLGIDAEATLRGVRGNAQVYPKLWKLKAMAETRLRHELRKPSSISTLQSMRPDVTEAWEMISTALCKSEDLEDRKLGIAIDFGVLNRPIGRDEQLR